MHLTSHTSSMTYQRRSRMARHLAAFPVRKMFLQFDDEVMGRESEVARRAAADRRRKFNLVPLMPAVRCHKSKRVISPAASADKIK